VSFPNTFIEDNEKYFVQRPLLIFNVGAKNCLQQFLIPAPQGQGVPNNKLHLRILL